MSTTSTNTSGSDILMYIKDVLWTHLVDQVFNCSNTQITNSHVAKDLLNFGLHIKWNNENMKILNWLIVVTRMKTIPKTFESEVGRKLKRIFHKWREYENNYLTCNMVLLYNTIPKSVSYLWLLNKQCISNARKLKRI